MKKQLIILFSSLCIILGGCSSNSASISQNDYDKLLEENKTLKEKIELLEQEKVEVSKQEKVKALETKDEETKENINDSTSLPESTITKSDIPEADDLISKLDEVILKLGIDEVLQSSYQNLEPMETIENGLLITCYVQTNICILKFSCYYNPNSNEWFVELGSNYENGHIYYCGTEYLNTCYDLYDYKTDKLIQEKTTTITEACEKENEKIMKEFEKELEELKKKYLN